MLKPKTEAAPAAADTTGRPGPKRKLKGGRRVNVYLDDPTFELAYAAMNGDKDRLSEALRLAVKLQWGDLVKPGDCVEFPAASVSRVAGEGAEHDEETEAATALDDASVRLWLKARTSPAED